MSIIIQDGKSEQNLETRNGFHIPVFASKNNCIYQTDRNIHKAVPTNRAKAGLFRRTR